MRTAPIFDVCTQRNQMILVRRLFPLAMIYGQLGRPANSEWKMIYFIYKIHVENVRRINTHL